MMLLSSLEMTLFLLARADSPKWSALESFWCRFRLKVCMVRSSRCHCFVYEFVACEPDYLCNTVMKMIECNLCLSWLIFCFGYFYWRSTTNSWWQREMNEQIQIPSLVLLWLPVACNKKGNLNYCHVFNI